MLIYLRLALSISHAFAADSSLSSRDPNIRPKEFPHYMNSFNVIPVDCHICWPNPEGDYAEFQSPLFEVYAQALSESEGAGWLIQGVDGANLRKLGFGAAVQNDGIFGTWSPKSELTLTEEVKGFLHIPEHATHFVWSYPAILPPEWDTVKKSGILLEHETLITFIEYGGFVYLDERNNPLCATTLVPVKHRSQGSLQFALPQPWKVEWTKELQKHGRFQPITIGALKSKEAKHFSWILPNEIIRGSREQPQNEHGAFAYLFSDNALEDDPRNRYFSVLDATNGWSLSDSEDD